MPPFRNPVSDSDDWTPPDYAKPASSKSSDDKWTPPEYAVSKAKEEPKKSFGSKVSDTVSGIVKAGKDTLRETGKFIDEHPQIRQIGQRLLTGESTEDTAKREAAGKPKPVGEEFQEFPGVRKATDYLSQKVAGPGDGRFPNLRLAAGAVVKGVGDTIASAADPRAMFIHDAPASELPIRRGTEIPYRMKEDVKPSTDISLKKDTTAVGSPQQPNIKYDKSAINSQGQTMKYKLKDKPVIATEPPVKQAEKSINPFEKPAKTEHDIQVDKSTDYLKKQVDSGEISADAAAKKQKTIDTKPQARFAYHDPEIGGDYYNIEGGPFDKSTKGEDFVKNSNIPIAEGPSQIKPRSSAVLDRLKASAVDDEQSQRNLIHQTESADDVTSNLRNRLSTAVSEAKTPELVNEGAPPIRQKTGDFFVDDKNRMDDAALSRRSDPIQQANDKAMMDDWNQKQANIKSSERPMRESIDSWKPPEYAELKAEKEPRGTTISMLGAGQGENLLRIAKETGEDIRSIAKRLKYDPTEEELNDLSKQAGRAGISAIGQEASNQSKQYDKSAINSQGISTRYKLKDNTRSSLQKLLNSLIEQKGASAEQQELYRTERAKRFSNFDSQSGEGVDWARKALSTLKGEYEKVNPGEGIGLNKVESNNLFTAVKSSQLTAPEKARGIASLFKLMNGEKILQPNEIETLDKVFSKHLGSVSGPGTPSTYDVGGEGMPDSFSKVVGSKKPDDFLSKLANFSSKATRSVLGFHVPGTAVSFHGFNEAIRNTVFGPDFNPFKAAGRFADSAHYLVNPKAAQKFLDINASDLEKAINEGGLKAATGDIGVDPMFKGDNFLSKGFNALTNPKPLFGQVIPALKLKSYNGLLEQYEKAGISHDKAAKMAGLATNNIFGGLNFKELERSPTTQKLFKAAALAPDWLESNVRLGKGMFNSIKSPKSPQNKVYQVGMANFLGSYIALNILNAVNNDGRFSFQNETGHELDVAIGKDSKGKVRYFSPYGTSMDMFKIPLEIGHAAVGEDHNIGKTFSDMRSRASEPAQFMTDLMTNTDYAGRSLYDKTKYGKHIPAMTQGVNIAGDAASHFLPIGAESGINLAQDKISPEQFASQVLQVPMKYKTPPKQQGGFRLQP